MADVGWNSLYWDNHDQPRAVSRFGDDSPEHRVNSAKTLATVQHMHKGTPYVYQGEELGMTNTYFSRHRPVPRHRVHQLSRGGAEPGHGGGGRDALAFGQESGQCAYARCNGTTRSHAGFTDGIPWLPVNPNYVTVNAAAQLADPDSVLHHFRKLIELRHDHPVVVAMAASRCCFLIMSRSGRSPERWMIRYW